MSSRGQVSFVSVLPRVAARRASMRTAPPLSPGPSSNLSPTATCSCTRLGHGFTARLDEVGPLVRPGGRSGWRPSQPPPSRERPSPPSPGACSLRRAQDGPTIRRLALNLESVGANHDLVARCDREYVKYRGVRRPSRLETPAPKQVRGTQIYKSRRFRGCGRPTSAPNRCCSDGTGRSSSVLHLSPAEAARSLPEA